MAVDLIDRGAKWLAGKRAAVLVREVTYRVNGGATLQVEATIGRTEFEVVTASGLVERIESRDFIVAAGVLGGDPKRGDRIVETDGVTAWTYEALSMPGQSHWRWADASRTAVRIFTKLVGTEVVGG